jgi:hypothetical protein
MADYEDIDQSKLPQKLTLAEYETWKPAPALFRDVLRYLYGDDPTTTAITTRLMAGRIRAGAESYSFGLDPNHSGGVIEIDPSRWAALDQSNGPNYDLWRGGNLTVDVEDRGHTFVTYFDVRFELEGVKRLMKAIGATDQEIARALPSIPLAPPPPKPEPPPPLAEQYPGGPTWVSEEYDGRRREAPKHAGGAPGKAFWDDLWAAMAALIYKGVIHPGSKQKDIEDAMVQWAIDHDEDLSVPSARIRARKLLAQLREAEKDKN